MYRLTFDHDFADGIRSLHFATLTALKQEVLARGIIHSTDLDRLDIEVHATGPVKIYTNHKRPRFYAEVLLVNQYEQWQMSSEELPTS